MHTLEKGHLPTNLEDWPAGPPKYPTYGSGEDEAYGAGVTGKLGPANLERNGDGSIVIDGDKVDNPEDYKAEPLEGGSLRPQRYELTAAGRPPATTLRPRGPRQSAKRLVTAPASYWEHQRVRVVHSGTCRRYAWPPPAAGRPRRVGS